MSTILTTTLLLTFAHALPAADPLAALYAEALANDKSPRDNTNSYNQSSSYGGSAGGQVVNTDAGAGGKSSSFHLSNGAIAAIAVVCALVVIFGIASAVLFYIAKKRQWQVRKSIKHASRRVTARVTGKKKTISPEEQDRLSRRKGAIRLKEEYQRDKRASQNVNVKETGVEMGERPAPVVSSKKEKRAVGIMPPK